jgi:protein-disulfide isomerase
MKEKGFCILPRWVRFGKMDRMINNQYQEKEKMEESNTSQEESVQEKKDRFLPISIIVAAVLICGAILFSVFYRGGSSTGKAAPVAVQPGTPPASLASLAVLGPRDEVLGNANASVTIIEYGDYQCPYCSRYFSQVQPLIKAQYLDTGKAKMVFRDFAFLDRVPGLPAGANESHDAAAAAQCANDQNKLWAYHDALYSAKEQDENAGGSENDGFYNRTLFLKLASQVGLDLPTFASCIDSKKNAAFVNQETTDASAAGVESTPTTIVNGKMVTESDGSSAGADPTAVIQAIANAVNGQ